ncbi:hypothetical protein LCGC14_0588000 [marine sediment metagenome]|uniref:Uncharacterized protein n=1 Tax=marine sediment metagenome TaxID=412755 RepID=A0A0F9RYB2_9ZZZZ
MSTVGKIEEIVKAGKAPAIRLDGRTSTARRAMGYVTITDPSATTQEWDTMMCIHCQYHWRVIPGSGIERGWCTSCNGALCGKAKCMATCRHWEKFIEQIEARGRVKNNLRLLRR